MAALAAGKLLGLIRFRHSPKRVESRSRKLFKICVSPRNLWFNSGLRDEGFMVGRCWGLKGWNRNPRNSVVPLHRHAVEALALGGGDFDFAAGAGDGFVAGEPGGEVGGVLEFFGHFSENGA